jgi:serine/threonine protein kinase
MHSKGIVHCDIKQDNLMLDKDNNLRIIDFGLVIYVNTKFSHERIWGTKEFMAPENLIGH